MTLKKLADPLDVARRGVIQKLSKGITINEVLIEKVIGRVLAPLCPNLHEERFHVGLARTHGIVQRAVTPPVDRVGVSAERGHQTFGDVEVALRGGDVECLFGTQMVCLVWYELSPVWCLRYV